jgi:hypothetical protein
MKSKKFSKKLVLKRTTVSNLGNNDLKNAKGGIAPTYPVTVCRRTCWLNPCLSGIICSEAIC